MSDVRKRRFRFVIIVLVIGGFLCWIALQQTSLAEAAQKGQTGKPVLQLLPASSKVPTKTEKLKNDDPTPTKAPTRPKPMKHRTTESSLKHGQKTSSEKLKFDAGSHSKGGTLEFNAGDHGLGREKNSMR